MADEKRPVKPYESAGKVAMRIITHAIGNRLDFDVWLEWMLERRRYGITISEFTSQYVHTREVFMNEVMDDLGRQKWGGEPVAMERLKTAQQVAQEWLDYVTVWPDRQGDDTGPANPVPID